MFSFRGEKKERKQVPSSKIVLKSIDFFVSCSRATINICNVYLLPSGMSILDILLG